MFRPPVDRSQLQTVSALNAGAPRGNFDRVEATQHNAAETVGRHGVDDAKDFPIPRTEDNVDRIRHPEGVYLKGSLEDNALAISELPAAQ